MNLGKSFYDNSHKNTTNRDFELSKFKITSTVASESLIKEFKNSEFSLLNRIVLQVSTLGKYKKIKETTLEIDDKFIRLKGNFYIRGFFQYEEYFKDIRDTLLKEFKPKIAISSENLRCKEIIQNSESISIHIRRGDHLHFENMNFHGICGKEYYLNAKRIIVEKAKNPIFFYFSDDVDWVIKNMDISENDYIIEHNTGDNSYWDLQLMSYCKHNIIANSSFSWWAAWLNENKNKIVIGPNSWYKNSKLKNINHCSKEWISLEPYY